MSSRIQGYEFPADLIELPIHEFNEILGMDWLSRHQAMIDCWLKRMSLQTVEGDEITVVGEGVTPSFYIVCTFDYSGDLMSVQTSQDV